MHALVTSGDDISVDAVPPPRLAQHYNALLNFNQIIFIVPASYLSSRHRVRYQPILIGTEFSAKTNPPDPINLLNLIMDLKR
jgi:hypothetical protein